MNGMKINYISECFIKPKYEINESKQPHYLAPLDLMKLSSHYIQKGLLFSKPSQSTGQEPYSTHDFLDRLKESLSITLIHFYPLAGQLVTRLNEEKHESLIFVDCNKGPGVKFIYAKLDTTVSNIISPDDVPLVVESFFDHHKASDHDGHTRPLLSVQITELHDGVFIGCSANHAVLDGTSYWEFWNAWSEVHMLNSKSVSKSRLPIFGATDPVCLPFIDRDEFISSVEPTQLRVKFFHFSSNSIKRLKSEANDQNDNSNNNISSFQALSALVWRSIIRSNKVCHDQVTNLRLTANNRHRLNPPLPREFFRNCVSLLTINTTAGELLENSLGYAASLLNKSIANHDDKSINDYLNSWLQAPSVPKHGIMYDCNSVLISSSPRFDMYGNEFGLGKAIAVRSGYANKFQGKVTAYAGCDGGTSVDLEICLPPEVMSALVLDVEFMDAVTF
ncbi:hypothetical protein RND81_08G144200 [Saponaria officinalis]|uniref:HXXXD-type acyl-transferase family protein n=1 Tax=Saponaria officinalis TaxID=3572 RepID=A0AAW1J7A0_SAPOF